MPSFSRETTERWRAERVADTNVPDNLTGNQPAMFRLTLDQDLAEEERRMKSALAQLRISRGNIKTLEQTSEKLRQKYGV